MPTVVTTCWAAEVACSHVAPAVQVSTQEAVAAAAPARHRAAEAYVLTRTVLAVATAMAQVHTNTTAEAAHVQAHRHRAAAHRTEGQEAVLPTAVSVHQARVQVQMPDALPMVVTAVVLEAAHRSEAAAVAALRSEVAARHTVEAADAVPRSVAAAVAGLQEEVVEATVKKITCFQLKKQHLI